MSIIVSDLEKEENAIVFEDFQQLIFQRYFYAYYSKTLLIKTILEGVPMKKLFSIFIFAGWFISAAIAENAGQWDASIYNLIEHPKTVALRIEVTDSDTGMPISDAQVLFRGTYTIKGRNSRHPDGERSEERKDYELTIATDNKGIAIASFGWHKEYPWSEGNDDIEKVQNIQIRSQDYYQVEMGLFFERFLSVGQRPDSITQEPAVFNKFEEAWHNECSRSDVRFCVFDLGTEFPDFGNKYSKRPEFFEKIYNKNWYKNYKEPQNWFSKGESPQSLCGPYFIYLVQIPMYRLKHRDKNQDSQTPSNIPSQKNDLLQTELSVESPVVAKDVIETPRVEAEVEKPVVEVAKPTTPSPKERNVALQSNGAVVTAINYGTYGEPQYPSNAIDGNPQIGWSSNWSCPAWLKVEFDSIYNINAVAWWTGSHKHDFTISLSTDNINWTTVVSRRTSTNSEAGPATYEYFPIPPMNAKYVQIDILTTSAPGGHIFQSSVGELEVYACNDSGFGLSNNNSRIKKEEAQNLNNKTEEKPVTKDFVETHSVEVIKPSAEISDMEEFARKAFEAIVKFKEMEFFLDNVFTKEDIPLWLDHPFFQKSLKRAKEERIEEKEFRESFKKNMEYLLQDLGKPNSKSLEMIKRSIEWHRDSLESLNVSTKSGRFISCQYSPEDSGLYILGSFEDFRTGRPMKIKFRIFCLQLGDSWKMLEGFDGHLTERIE
jgi:hypothetical protein